MGAVLQILHFIIYLLEGGNMDNKKNISNKTTIEACTDTTGRIVVERITPTADSVADTTGRIVVQRITPTGNLVECSNTQSNTSMRPVQPSYTVQPQLYPIDQEYYTDGFSYYWLNPKTNDYIDFTNYTVQIKKKTKVIHRDQSCTCTWTIQVCSQNGIYVDLTIEDNEYNSLDKIIAKRCPGLNILNDKFSKAGPAFKRILSYLISQSIPTTTIHDYFGWDKDEKGNHIFFHGDRPDCTSEKIFPPFDKSSTSWSKVSYALNIFKIADKSIIYPLFLYQAAAFMDALLSEADHPLQHCMMAIAKTGSFKSSLFKVIFDPFTAMEKKLKNVNSTQASFKVLHEEAYDDVLIVDDFNTEGQKAAVQKRKDTINYLIGAYGDKTDVHTWKNCNETQTYPLRGGCVITSEEQLNSILSRELRYVKVEFTNTINKAILTDFQNNPTLIPTFWAGFILYLEANYIDIVHYISTQFDVLRNDECLNQIRKSRLKDNAIHLIIAAYFINKYIYCMEIFKQENSQNLFDDMKNTIIDLIKKQDHDSSIYTPELRFLNAVYDCIAQGSLKIANDEDQYNQNPSYYAGYKNGNIEMLFEQKVFPVVQRYYTSLNTPFNDNQKAVLKELKRLNLIDAKEGYLIRSSSRIKGRPRLIGLRSEECHRYIEKNINLNNN